MKAIFPVLLCLIIGLFVGTVAPAASSAVSALEAPAPASSLRAASIAAARAEAVASARQACAVLLSYSRVTRCTFVEWNPSIDFEIEADRTEAIQICARAVKILAVRAPGVVGKGMAARVLRPGGAPPTAACALI